MTGGLTKFPPIWGHLEIPTSSRSAALAGLALYAPCKRWTIVAHRIIWLMTSTLGPKALPGRRQVWKPPMEEDTWRGLLHEWESSLGHLQGFAVYHRRPAGRQGFNLLALRDGEPCAFLKLRAEVDIGLSNEFEALRRVRDFGPRSFQAPQCLALGVREGWHYLALTPLPPRLHRPPRDPPLHVVVQEIVAALHTLPRDARVPPHWRPMHGDFTPWNLRRLDAGPLMLFDWEDAGWGPPGADEVLFRATEASLGRRVDAGWMHEEAMAYWQERLHAKQGMGPGGEHRVARLLRRVLRREPTSRRR
jgi:phosphotransferase family enzyme